MIIIQRKNYTWYVDENWLIFLSALITYILRINFNKIRAYQLKKNVKNKNIQKIKADEFSNIDRLSSRLQKGTRWSLLVFAIMLITNELKKNKVPTTKDRQGSENSLDNYNKISL